MSLIIFRPQNGHGSVCFYRAVLKAFPMINGVKQGDVFFLGIFLSGFFTDAHKDKEALHL